MSGTETKLPKQFSDIIKQYEEKIAQLEKRLAAKLNTDYEQIKEKEKEYADGFKHGQEKYLAEVAGLLQDEAWIPCAEERLVKHNGRYVYSLYPRKYKLYGIDKIGRQTIKTMDDRPYLGGRRCVTCLWFYSPQTPAKCDPGEMSRHLRGYTWKDFVDFAVLGMEQVIPTFYKGNDFDPFIRGKVIETYSNKNVFIYVRKMYNGESFKDTLSTYGVNVFFKDESTCDRYCKFANKHKNQWVESLH